MSRMKKSEQEQERAENWEVIYDCCVSKEMVEWTGTDEGQRLLANAER